MSYKLIDYIDFIKMTVYIWELYFEFLHLDVCFWMCVWKRVLRN